MSTRAAYTFLPNPKANKAHAVFYIHHDGYPAGAAQYLLAMIAQGGQVNADTFYRANERAQLIHSADTYGDIEYKYTIDQRVNNIRVEQRQYGAAPDWRIQFNGPIVDFLNRNAGEPVKEILYASYMSSTFLASPSIIEAKIQEAQDKLESYRAAHPQMLGNINSLQNDVERAKGWLACFEAVTA